MGRYQSAIERHEAVQKMPDPTWYVEGLIPNGFTIIGAKSKMYKSWFCLQMATAITTGQPFLGRKTKQAKVLYLDFETNEKLSDARLIKQLGDDPIPEDLYVEKDARDWKFDGGKLEEQLRYIVQNTDIKVIIIDVIRKIKPRMGKQETEYDVASKMGDLIKEIIDPTDIAVIGVMHCNKGSFNEEDPFNTLLGSVGWQGVSDNAIVWQKKHRTDTSAYLSTSGRVGADVSCVINWNDADNKWHLVGNTDELNEMEELNAYNRKPTTRIVKLLLGADDTWRGTAQDALAKLEDPTLSADSVGRYLNSSHCKEIKARDGISIVKRRTSHGAEYIITRNFAEAMADPEVLTDIFEQIA